MPFFGTPSFSFFGGVPLDLVVTPEERGDSLTGCSPALSSEKVRRSSLCRGGEVSPTSSKVASELSFPSSSEGSLEDTDTKGPAGRKAPAARDPAR